MNLSGGKNTSSMGGKKIVHAIPMGLEINTNVRYLLFAFFLMLAAKNVYCQKGYCPQHSAYVTQKINEEAKEKAIEVAIKQLKKEKHLKEYDRVFKAVEARWKDQTWISKKMSTHIGTLINQYDTLQDAYDHISELSGDITTLFLEGTDGLTKGFTEEEKSKFAEAMFGITYAFTACVLQDQSLIDQFAQDYNDNYEKKSFWGKLGFDLAYRITAWCLGDDKLLECTHASPNCPKQKDDKEKGDDNKGGSIEDSLPVERSGGNNGNGGKSVLTPLKSIEIYREGK